MSKLNNVNLPSIQYQPNISINHYNYHHLNSGDCLNSNYSINNHNNNNNNNNNSKQSLNHVSNYERTFVNANNNSHNNYANYSPSATLTPGRKSASPCFFHSNEYLLQKSLNNHTSSFYPFNLNNKQTLNNNQHLHSQYLNINQLNNHTNNFNYSNYLNQSSHQNSHHNSLNTIHYSNINEQLYNQNTSLNQDPIHLKIPTTPTRSKSLSPSLRCVIQPPRLRLKQETKANSNAKKETSENTSIKTENTILAGKRNSENMLSYDSSLRTNNFNTSSSKKLMNNNNENSYFEPISLKKLNINNSNHSNDKNKTQTQYSDDINSNSNKNKVNEQKDKNLNISSTKYSPFESKLSNLNNTKPSKLNEFDDIMSHSHNNLSSQTNIIKKPIPILANNKNSKLITNTNSKENNVYFEPIEQAKAENDDNVSPKVNKDLSSIPLKSIETNKNLQTNNETDKIADIENTKEKCDLEKFKLPFNLRMINLNNFPPSQAPNSKRHYSIHMQKMKALNSQNSDKSLNSLKQSIQFILNQELKLVFDRFKQDFIDPAIKNLKQNEKHLSQQDLNYLITNLLDEAKNSYLNEIESLEENCKIKKSPKLSSSPSNDLQKWKRKTDEDSSEEITEDSSADSVKKQKKLNNNDISSNLECLLDHEMVNLNKKETKFDSKTQFVLGKNVNDIFYKIQQHYFEINSEDSNSSSLSEISNSKSIYTKFPNLFRYETDQYDRKWLNENKIIKRKNLRCYLLILEEIDELFSTNFKFNNNSSNNQSNEKSKNDEFILEDKESILKKLRPFCIPDFILYKLKRNYMIQKS